MSILGMGQCAIARRNGQVPNVGKETSAPMTPVVLLNFASIHKRPTPVNSILVLAHRAKIMGSAWRQDQATHAIVLLVGLV